MADENIKEGGYGSLSPVNLAFREELREDATARFSEQTPSEPEEPVEEEMSTLAGFGADLTEGTLRGLVAGVTNPALLAGQTFGDIRFQLFDEDGTWNPDITTHSAEEVQEEVESGESSMVGTEFSEYEAETIAGGFTNTIAELTPSLIGVGKIFGGLRGLSGLTAVPKTVGGIAVEGAVVGGLADFLAFEGNDQNLADGIATIGGFSEDEQMGVAILDWLRTDEADSDLEGRIKAGISAGVFGAVADPIMRMVLGLKHGNKQMAEDSASEVMSRITEVTGGRAVSPEELKIFQQAVKTYSAKTPGDVTEAVLKDADIGMARAGVEAAGEATEKASKATATESVSEAPKANTGRDTPQAPKEAVEEDISYLRRALSEGDYRSGYSVTGFLNSFLSKVDENGWTKYLDDVTEPIRTKGVSNEEVAARGAQAAKSGGKTSKIADEVAKVDYQQQLLIKSLDEVMKNMEDPTALRALGLGSREDADVYVDMLTRAISEADQNYTTLLSDIGRALQFSKYNKLRITGQSPSEILEANTKMARKQAVKQAQDFKRELNNSLGALERTTDTATYIKQIKEARKRVANANGFFVRLNRMRIANILSGVSTHQINITSTALNVVMRAVAGQGGALLGDAGRALTGNFSFAASKYQAQYIKSLTSTLVNKELRSRVMKATGEAMKTGESIFDPSHGTLEVAQGAIFGDIGGLGKAGQAADFMFSIPGRMLATSDDFFKSIVYTSSLKAQAVVKGKAQGLFGRELDDFVNTYIKKGFSNTGKPLNAQAIFEARRATFTEDLGTEGALGLPGQLQQIAQQGTTLGQAMRFVFPFVRTPTNLISEALSFTGMPALLKGTRMQNDLLAVSRLKKAGNYSPEQMAFAQQRQSIAIGKMMVAGSIYGYMAENYENGMLTGKAPDNYAERVAWEEEGRIPYAIKIGNKWYSYERLDPLSTVIGTITDGFQLYDRVKSSQQPGVPDSKSITDLEAAQELVAATFAGLVDSTYMMTLNDIVTMVTDAQEEGDPNKVSKFDKKLANQLSGIVVPNILKQIISAIDNPDLEKVKPRNLEELYYATLGFQSGVTKQYGYIGETLKLNTMRADPLNLTGDETNTQPYAEFMREAQQATGVGWGRDDSLSVSVGKGKPKASFYDVVFVSGEYKGMRASDVYFKMLNNFKDGTGRTLSENLNDLVQDDKFRSIPWAVRGAEDPKVKRFKSIRQWYAKRAKEFVQSMPEFQQMIREGRY